MSITTKLTLLFFFFATIIMSIVGGLAYHTGHDALEDAVISDLISTATEKHAALDAWIEHSSDDIAAVASSPDLCRYVSDYVSSGLSLEGHDRVVVNLQPWLEGPRFSTLMVIDPGSGRVIAATDSREEGTFKENRSYFIQGQRRSVVDGPYYSAHLQRTAMTAAAPIYSENGDLVGVLAARINLSEIEEIISRRTDRHESDDAYLVDASRLPITLPRLITNFESLAAGIRTEQVDRCVVGESGVLLADDYRGIPVIAVYRWIPDRNLCLLVELDQAEAYAPIRTFGIQLLIIALPILGAAGLIAFGLARTITRPVLALKQSAIRFGEGDLSVRLPEGAQDELGLLAREFNAMATALEKKEVELHLQAEELRRANAELERAFSALSESEERFRLLAQENAELAEVKTRLLHEVNHRVKNNLAAIIGLLYSERNRIKSRNVPEYQMIMKDLISRVQGLATVHQLLSDSEWRPLELDTLVDQIVNATVKALATERKAHVEVQSSEVVFVKSDQAHNIAMIINELTTNSLKYAQSQALIRIRVDILVDGDTVTLIFSDRGPGYPDEVVQMNDWSVGLDLVHHIVTRNMKGKLLLRNDGGAMTTIRFATGVLS